MKKVKAQLIGTKIFGLSAEEGMANFINEKNIQKEDIIQIVHAAAGYTIFYYAEENEK